MAKYRFSYTKVPNETKGFYGERTVDVGIDAAQRDGYTGRILHNIYVPKGQGKYTEIDVLYITKKGIFVFESKNVTGWIFGDGESTYWTLSAPSGEKHKLYNPILQNQGHIRHLSKNISQSIPFFSVILLQSLLRCAVRSLTKRLSRCSNTTASTLFLL